MLTLALAAQGVMAGAALHAILATRVRPLRWGGRQERRGTGSLDEGHSRPVCQDHIELLGVERDV
jgi:hypothetical protein